MVDLRSLLLRLDPERSLLLGGRWCPSRAGTFPVEDPATARVIAHVADGTQADARAAVDAAAGRLPAWSGVAPRVRSELLYKVRELMLRDADELTALIAAENGKSIPDAAGEVAYAAEFFRWYAEEAVRSGGGYGRSPSGGTRNIVTSRPVGVAALVTPWNFPAAMITRKIAPALAAGCTLVVKPASETPLTALAIVRLINEAGVPDGVVNVVTTSAAGEVVSTWLQDSRVRKLSFTGSTNVGRILLRQAADRVVNTSLELGGSAPFIVTADADTDAAVEAAMVAKFRNGGQACTAANSFFVHADAAAAFTANLGARVEALRVGPAGDGFDIGPLISKTAQAEVGQCVNDAVAAGATIAHRAAAATADGHFFSPIVLTGVQPGNPIVGQEIFGPIAPIVTWTDLDEVVATVNATELGLAAYVFAGDRGDAIAIAERLECGMVGVNRGLVSDPSAPFGGVKQSGLGREGSRHGLEEYLETQYLSVDW